MGGHIADIRPWALDYTLSAMFIALLVMQIKHRLEVVVALLTGLLAVALARWGVGQWGVILATVTGATIGVALERLLVKRDTGQDTAQQEGAR